MKSHSKALAAFFKAAFFIFAFLSLSPNALADIPNDPGNISVTVTDPSNAPIANASVKVLCDSGTATAIGTTDASGIVTAAAAPGASNCSDGSAIALKFSKPGYLDGETYLGSTYGQFTYSAGSSNSYAVTLFPVEAGNTDSYLAEFWNNPYGTQVAPLFPSSAPDFSSTAPSISYDWGALSPGNGINNDGFLARFSKTVNFSAGDYVFKVASDDGAKIYIDGSLISEFWGTRGIDLSNPDVATSTISAGNHTITVEYYEYGGSAAISFWYAPVSSSTALAAVYESADAAVTPDSPGTPGDTSSLSAQDSNYLITASSTNDSGFDTQVYKFAPNLTGINAPKFTINWFGHGAVPDEKKVHLSVWNTLSSAWEELASSHCATDCMLTGIADGSKYKDSNGNVWLSAKADNSYPGFAISGITDNAGLLPIQWTTSQPGTTVLGIDTAPHQNFADYATHMSDSNLVTSHSMTPAVSDNSTKQWRAVASSADGAKLAGVVGCGDIWTSSDHGTTWTDQTDPGSQCWTSVASSADGNTLVASVSGGDLWSGTLSGSTWTWTNLSSVSSNYPGTLDWTSIAISANSSNGGYKIAASSWNSDIWTAIKATSTWAWTDQTGSGSQGRFSLAMSADGTKIATGQWCGDIEVGTFDGTSWTWADQPNTGNCWRAFAMSADGTKVLAGENWPYVVTGTFDGTSWTWTERTNLSSIGSWYGAAISSNGSKMEVASYCGPVIGSSDGGENWTTLNSQTHCWQGLASSADGSTLLGAAASNDLYLSIDSGVTWNDVTGTRWYYRIQSVNQSGQTVVSDERSFIYASTNSCPFVFTYDGNKYRFVIDASNSGNLGIGLDRQLWDATPFYKDPNANNGYPNPLSYTKIPTNALAARTVGNETFYDIKTTTELDEVNYYDKAALEVIDHDPSISVYPDYRNTPQFHVIAKDAPAPVSVTDQRGTDVKSLVASDDNIYWHSVLAGSASSPTYLTIRLLSATTTPAHLKLVIKGTKEGPLSGGKGSDQLQYLNSSGVFVKVPSALDPFVVTRAGAAASSRNFQNTYGIQTKVIDLSGLAIKNNTIRLITTSTQRQWDIDWLAVDTSPDTGFTVTEETPYSADLHLRGISQLVLSNPNDPDMSVTEPAYDSVVKTVGKGFPLTGAATRYGDVTPLLSAVDDKFVIMTQGDELALKYAVPAQSEGTERDFIYYTWDYHKPHHDALGHTILPLPFNAMTSYPYHENLEHYPTDQAHQDYQNAYNTRIIDWGTVQDAQLHHSLNTDLVTLAVSESTQFVVRSHSSMIIRAASAIPAAVMQAFQSQQQAAPASGSPITAKGLPAGFQFKTDLRPLATKDDVKMLQIFLNSNGFDVSAKGAGSKGKENSYLGLKTKQALIRFQEAFAKDILAPQGLKKGTGILGPYTRKVINAWLAGADR